MLINFTLIFNEFSNAGRHTLAAPYLGVRNESGLACAAHAAAVHPLLSIATKVGKNAFYLSEQKALISAKQVFSHTPTDGSLED